MVFGCVDRCRSMFTFCVHLLSYLCRVQCVDEISTLSCNVIDGTTILFRETLIIYPYFQTRFL